MPGTAVDCRLDSCLAEQVLHHSGKAANVPVDTDEDGAEGDEQTHEGAGNLGVHWSDRQVSGLMVKHSCLQMTYSHTLWSCTFLVFACM